MLDQALVRSGFDIEILLGERQLSYFILALIDAGTIPTTFQVGDPPKPIKLRGPGLIDRTYDPLEDASLPPAAPDSNHPGEVEILFEDMRGADVRLHLVADISAHSSVIPLDRVEVDFFVKLDLLTERDEQGLLTDAKLKIELLDFESPVFDTIAQAFHIDKPTVLATLKDNVDREVDMGGIGAFKRIHDLAFRKHQADDEHARAIGLYVNLRLQKGPEPDNLLAERGNLDDALNFLPAGSDAAMATRSSLYGDIARDGFQRFAEEKDDGSFHYPWHKSIRNPKSEVIGKIVGVSAGPNPTVPNMLRIDVEVEYKVDNFFDPNAHLVLNLTPVTNAQGVLDWRVDADFHASVLLEIIGFLVLASLFTGFGAIIGLGVGAAISFGIIAGSLSDALGHFIVDELYSGRAEKKADAAIPDVVNGRIEVARKRWDPLYETHHQVAMRPDGAIINASGIALWGRAALDRQVRPVPHAVIRDEVAQAPSPPTHLLYRVIDAEDFRDQFGAVAPGTDRRDIARPDPIGEPTLFQLSIEQIVDRLAEERIVPDLAYIAKRIDMRQHQVHSILAISNREVSEQRNALIGAFEAATRPAIEAEQGAQIRMDVIAGFEAEGVTPTEEEIVARVQEVIDEILAGETDAYIDGPLSAQLEEALKPLLRFDLAPEYFAALQKKKILHLLDLEIIEMRDGFLYYRDHPDFYKPDNLHSLPRYRETPGGPVLL